MISRRIFLIKSLILYLFSFSINIFSSFPLNIIGIGNDSDLIIKSGFYGNDIDILSLEEFFKKNYDSKYIKIDKKFKGLNQIELFYRNKKYKLNFNVIK